MKAFIDVKVNGQYVTVEVFCSYDIDPEPAVTTVKLGTTEIIHTLDSEDIQYLNWCAEQEWMGTGAKRRRHG